MIPMKNNMFLYGIVEDVMDPLRLGRVRTRWFGIHTDNKSKLPTNGLPWSNVMGSINSAGISGVGYAPVGMVPGTMVFGIPIDEGMQEFMIFGTQAGNRAVYGNGSLGFNDPSGEYPRSGIAGDINSKAGGNGDSGSQFATDTASQIAEQSSIVAEIPNAVDPTVPAKPKDPPIRTSAPWMQYAQKEVGVNEKDNASRITEYHTIGGGLTREPTVAWCASFIGWCLKQADITGTRSASSRSYKNYGKSVGTTKVPFGSIAIFGVPGSGFGHVAFVVEDKGDKLVCIGGNQSDKSLRSGGIVSNTTIPKNGKSLVLLDCVFPTQ